MKRDLNKVFTDITRIPINITAGIREQAKGYVSGVSQMFGGEAIGGFAGQMLGKLTVVGAVAGLALDFLKKIADWLSQASPYLKGILDILNKSFMIMFKPFGDFIAILLRPLALLLLQLARQWLPQAKDILQKMRTGEITPAVANVQLAGTWITTVLGGLLSGIGEAILKGIGEGTVKFFELFDIKKITERISTFLDWEKLTERISTFIDWEKISKNIEDFINWEAITKRISDFINWEAITKRISDFIDWESIEKTISDFINWEKISKNIEDFIKWGDKLIKDIFDFISFRIETIRVNFWDFFETVRLNIRELLGLEPPSTGHGATGTWGGIAETITTAVTGTLQSVREIVQNAGETMASTYSAMGGVWQHWTQQLWGAQLGLRYVPETRPMMVHRGEEILRAGERAKETIVNMNFSFAGATFHKGVDVEDAIKRSARDSELYLRRRLSG